MTTTSERTERPKITPFGLKIAANTHLEGTNLGELIASVRLDTDNDGNVLPHVIDNLRKALKVACDMTKDDIIARKSKAMHDFLEEYEAS